jgi:spore germination protein PD
MRVINGQINVGSVRLIGITSSSAFLIGDTESFTLYSFFDTPPESVIVGPLAPLPQLPEEDAE